MIDIELTLLRAITTDRHLLGRAVGEGFRAELLPPGPLRTIAEAALAVHESGSGRVDAAAIEAHLTDHGAWNEEVAHYMGAVLAAQAADAAQVVQITDLLKVRDTRARLAAVGDRIQEFLREGGATDLGDLATDLAHELLRVQQERLRRKRTPVREAFTSLRQGLLPAGGGRRFLGYAIAPYDALTEALSGLRRGFYYGIAGAPRRGKTNFALSIATHVAGNHRIPVLYYSWEQTTRVLAARLLARELMVSPAEVMAGGSAAVREARGRLGEAWKRMDTYMHTLYLIEGGRKDTVDRIKSQAFNVMHAFQTDQVVLVIDYLQKMPLGFALEDTKARTDELSTQLSDLSLELNAPVVAISPLDKEGCRLDERPPDDLESAPFHRPTMHHAVGSGDLEYDLDVALVLAKDWEATRNLQQLLEAKAASGEIDETRIPRIDIINVHIDKNRDSPDAASQTIQYAFFISSNRYLELGFKLEAEFDSRFHGFAKTQDLYGYLQEHGYVTAPGVARAG